MSRHFAWVALSIVASSLGLGACSKTEGAAPPSTDEQAFTEGPALAYDEYEVLFTNPECRDYLYPATEDVRAANGDRLLQKPKNAFCTKADADVSAARASSPQKKLLEWVRDPATKEIFMAYLSFSNEPLADALCEAVRDRGVKVTMVLDRETGTTAAERVKACHPAGAAPELQPRLELRGHDATVGFAHNKLFIVNPGADKMKFVFSSGNASSGLVTHHENWHFLTLSRATHFAQAHLCLKEGMLDHYRTKAEYKDFIQTCRDAITKGEEADLKTFFIPGDGSRAGRALTTSIRAATKIQIAAHRFSYSLIRNELSDRLTGASPPEVQLVVDDDVHWIGNREVRREQVPNTFDEYEHVTGLADEGMELRYMETNMSIGQLQHNKFMVFSLPTGDAVFAGAGNFTGTAFTENFENFYFIKIPHVVRAMKAQHAKLFDLATDPDHMPTKLVAPVTRP